MINRKAKQPVSLRTLNDEGECILHMEDLTKEMFVAELKGDFYCQTCSEKQGHIVYLDDQLPSIFDPEPKPYECLYCGSKDINMTIDLSLRTKPSGK